VRTVAERLAGEAAVVTINTEQSPQLAARYNVRGIPALLLLHEGRVVDQVSGNQPVEAVVVWFRKRR